MNNLKKNEGTNKDRKKTTCEVKSAERKETEKIAKLARALYK